MEISISRKGDLQVLGVKGKIRLQNWRVLDKHLETMLENGARWVAMDLSGVTLICSTGIGSIMHNVRKFRNRDANLLLVAASPYMQDLFQVFGCESWLGHNLFFEWRALEDRLLSQGLAISVA
jgi:anti-anti-sigma factor